MEYLVAIHKDPDSDYGVTVPDLEGCFSAGSTLAEAIEMVAESMSLHIESMIEDGEPLPQPRTLDELSGLEDFSGAIWEPVSPSDYVELADGFKFEINLNAYACLFPFEFNLGNEPIKSPFKNISSSLNNFRVDTRHIHDPNGERKLGSAELMRC